MWFITAVCMVAIGLFAVVCATQAKAYYMVGETINRMLYDPEGFCDYIEANTESFNEQFKNCLKTHINIREVKSQQIYDCCAEIHAGNQDWIWACFYDDDSCGGDGGVFEYQIAWLEIMESMTGVSGIYLLITAKTIYNQKVRR